MVEYKIVDCGLNISEIKDNEWYAIKNDGQYCDFTAIKKIGDVFEIEDLWVLEDGTYTNRRPNDLPEGFFIGDGYLKVVVTLEALNAESKRNNKMPGEVKTAGEVKTLKDVSIRSANLYRVADCGRVKVEGFHVEDSAGKVIY